MNNAIIIKGAEEHNLKKISITIERNKFVVITGVSGSGKSSLAFNTLYAEGQRRYVESLSTYARQFIGHMNKPAVESIEGLSPAIAIEQKTIGRNPRSTVGTITEIYDYYRLMFARIGVPYDPDTNLPLQRTTIDEIVDIVLSYPEGTKLMVLSPVVRNKKGTHGKIIEDARKLGFTRLRIDGTLTAIDDDIALQKTFKHSIDIVTGRVVISSKTVSRVVEAFEKAMELSQGNASALFIMDNSTEEERHFSLHYAYQNPEYSVPEIEPQLFSFNSPVGSCPQCSGLGYTMEFNESLVIPDYSLNFYEHGIAPFSEKWNWYSTQIEGLARALGVSLHDPFDAWPKDAIRQLLYGSEKNISFIFKSASGTRSITRRFPGLLHELLRRYRTTQDPGFREWLEQFMEKRTCSMCEGGRLRKEALFVKVNDVSIQQLTAMTVLQSIEFFEQLQLSERDSLVAKEILREIQSRLSFLKEVGLSYLSMDRYAGTLSGGESQRIRLASQIGSALVGVMYVLDEPTIGLHQRDNERLLQMLLHLRDLGNTIIVVEHDEQAINTADTIVDIGPLAGKNGGEVVAHGTPVQVMKTNTLTGKYLSGKLFMKIPRKRREGKGTYISLYGACEHNLKSIDVTFPLGTLNVITGVSGSGKSTLLQDILYPAIHNVLLRTKLSCGSYQKIEGIEFLNKVIDIDQSPIGRTPRSNPGTYVKIFDGIRALFAQLPESKARGYTPGRFSFNVRGGRCEACQGAGEQIIEMHFLSDVYVTCEVCQGKRFNRETLDIYYRGKNVCDVLNMTVDEAAEFFEKIPGIYRRLKVLQQVGMGYITLGQSAVTLSGGEAQRIKLALELAKQNTGNTLYLLDEPTTGLHQADIINLMKVLHELVDRGNTIILIEHNLEVIAQADYILDLGPEGGYDGGEVVACGTPEQIIHVKKSYTGVFLKSYLQRRT